MRTVQFLLIAASLAPCGCSWLIIRSGTDIGSFTRREEVQAKFGKPVEVVECEEGAVEEYFTRRKIAEPQKSMGLAMGYAITLGLGEFICFPHQLGIAMKRSAMGQNLKFTYDGEGNITEIKHDGEHVLLWNRVAQDSPPPSIVKEPTTSREIESWMQTTFPYGSHFTRK